MPHSDHLAILKEGAPIWNRWRAENPQITPNLSKAKLGWENLNKADLSWANLSGADLREADMRRANLNEANLHKANLAGAFLSDAYLSMADLSETNLSEADLLKANLSGANLNGANLNWANLSWTDLSGVSLVKAHLIETDLREANLSGADLTEANLKRAYLWGANFCWAMLVDANLESAALAATVFGSTNLTGAKGLEDCRHTGPSILDIRTLQKSGELPLSFLQNCGLSSVLIKQLPSLLDKKVKYSSCFISYSSQDEEFARKLHDDLQKKGVRCWGAPEDMKMGDRVRSAIDDAILTHEKLLIVLSRHSSASAWAPPEVEAALEEEDRRGCPILFPIKLDESIMECQEQWAEDLRQERAIVDFRQWNNKTAYAKAFKLLLQELEIPEKL
ncbi:MAG: toll/interleukin-1 receptor domain-containing protein [Candidatus Omnitrophota bacterium]